ncbi:MAG TPA: ammonium transporter [Sporichthyaceae bacterium]|nr:ammonium transporter [Sporichthyaceae bacterium]
MDKINAADTAWVLAATTLVMLMVPGLAIFYGGMVRARSVLNTMMMTFVTLGIVTVVWVGWGYSLAFGKDHGPGLIGGFGQVGLKDTMVQVYGTIPTPVFAMFQLMFALVTCALVSGSIVDRAKFGTWCVFTVIWTTVVYVPEAHWVFFSDGGKGGWLIDRMHVFDFAGGTAVEINSGASGLALALILGPRLGWKKDPMRPHNLPLVMLGAGLLWFGWFGFNAGSALGANAQAGLALANTQIAGALGVVGWLAVERLRDGTFTSFGAASGAVAGLVAITPACASITPVGAIAVGTVAGAVCSFAVTLKYRVGYDDSLDVAGVHMIGGIVGLLMIGLVCSAQATGILNSHRGVDGLLYGGGLQQLGRQAVAVGAAFGYSFTVTLLIGWVLHKTLGFRVERDHEISGVDLALHAEAAYELAPAGASTGRMAGSHD